MRDNRQILRGIRVPVARPNAKPDKEGVIHKFASLTYVSGMEDELAAAFSQEQLDKFLAIGSISGDWKSKKSAERVRVGGKFAPAPPAP